MSTGIALTKFMCLLDKPIVLSEIMGITIDNPRTDNEIELIKNYIRPSVIAEGPVFVTF